MVKLTDAAVAAVHRCIEGSEDRVQGLRITITGGGCSGLQYGLQLEPKAGPEDTVLDYGAVKVFIDPVSLPLMTGAFVDFIETLGGSGFKFVNPNARSSCSCGKSFSV